MKEFTFSDGTIIPAGVTMAAPRRAMLIDDTIYENAKEFRWFRFSELREHEGDKAKYLAANTSPEFLHFGHGRHTW